MKWLALFAFIIQIEWISGPSEFGAKEWDVNVKLGLREKLQFIPSSVCANPWDWLFDNHCFVHFAACWS